MTALLPRTPCESHARRKMNRDEKSKSVLSVVLFLPLVLVSPVAPSDPFALDVVAVAIAACSTVDHDAISHTDQRRLAALLKEKGTLYTRTGRAWRQHAWGENIRKAVESGVRRTSRVLAIQQPRAARNTAAEGREAPAGSTEKRSPTTTGGRIEDVT